MPFQQDNAHSHMTAAKQCAFRGVKQLPWPARSPFFRQLNMYGTRLSRNLLFFHSLPQPLPNCDNGCKIIGTIRRLYDHLHVRIHACIVTRRATLYWCDYLGSLHCDMCVSFDLNLSYTPTMINYLSHQFAIEWICPWGRCIFFWQFIIALILNTWLLIN